MFNEFGRILKLTTFGESHGCIIGGVLDGMPSGVNIDLSFIQKQLDKRKPGQSKIVTQRKEDDVVNLVSGIFQGKTTGQPIGFNIKNINQKSEDYHLYKTVFRPSHADFTYFKKYDIRDYRGGGRSSARETANWVVGGALAKHLIPKVEINAFVSSVEDIEIDEDIYSLNLSNIYNNQVRCPDNNIAQRMIERIEFVRKQGDSVGGTISCIVRDVPIGLGEPIFDKLSARLAQAMMSINTAKAFEIGGGFDMTKSRGSNSNDMFNEDFSTKTNNSGGIQGGISNGMDIIFKVGFKPVATIMKNQEMIDEKGIKIRLKGKGRHDPCVLPRAVVIVESLTSLVLADFYLIDKIRRLKDL